jgi:hypothetical protein
MDEMELGLNSSQGECPGMIWGPQTSTQTVPDFLRLATHFPVRPRSDISRVIIVISHACNKVVRNYAQA